MSKPIVAILYDFDATLATSDMQNFSFIPSLGLTPDEFWGKTKEFSEKTGCEKTLGYIYTMIAECKKRGIKMTRSFLREQGKGIKFWPGVDTWFERINKFGEENGVEVEHYLVSSGNKEIVEGCSIYKYFKMVYGCEFIFDENDEPIWPKLVINYTQKTQYFYRVSKGAFDINDDVGVNEKNRNRRVPYSNIVYIGDGLTDIPAMILAKNNGGHSIAVYPEGREGKVVDDLYHDGRVNYVAPADYREGKELDEIMRLIIKGISINESLKQRGNMNKENK
jgi:2-hydroxy-3-keto-5-methylthiopentenyl-1-phosphate phosphatase